MVAHEVDRLASTMKPTGDPSCPPRVLRAKRIPREILVRVNAVTVGQKSDEEEAESGRGSVDGALSIRKRKRHHRARGKHVEEEDDGLLSYEANMSRAICTMADNGEGNNGVFKDKVKGIVKEGIKEQLTETNRSIAELKALLRTYVGARRLRDGM